MCKLSITYNLKPRCMPTYLKMGSFPHAIFFKKSDVTRIKSVFCHFVVYLFLRYFLLLLCCMYGSPGGTFLLITTEALEGHFYLLLITYYLILITYYLLLTTYHLLLTTYYLSFHLSPL